MRELESHCQCDNCSGDDCRDLPKPKTLSEHTTYELVEELIKREGVISITIDDYAYIAHGKKPSIKIEESATILVIK